MGDVIHALPACATLKHSFPGPLSPGSSIRAGRSCSRPTPSSTTSSAWIAARPVAWPTPGAPCVTPASTSAVDFQGLIQSALVASIAHPDRIFGFHQSQVREKLAALFYSSRVRSTAVHVVDRNLELAAAAGASTILLQFPLPAGIPEGDLPEGGFVLANPQAGWGAKQWPLEHFRVLARRLRDELGLPLVLNGPPARARCWPPCPARW